MNNSKTTIVVLVAIIIAGTAAWAGTEWIKSPDYNPEKAHEFLEHFYARCGAEFDDEVCGDVVGNHHRSCFTDHLRDTPPDQVDEQGPVIYDRRAYTRCMDQGIEEELSRSGP